MPFAKGKSGNKRGRPRGGVSLGLRELREDMRQDVPAARRLLRKVMSRAETELKKKGEIQNHVVVAGVRAAEQVMVWSYGKPSPWPEDGIPPEIARLPAAEQLRALEERADVYQQAIAALRQRMAAEGEHGEAPPTH